MIRFLPWAILIGMTTILLSISFSVPELLNDNNDFLRGFVNQEFLAVLGFIAAVTLASAASFHFELNRLEDDTGQGFRRTRRSIAMSAYSLIALFAIALLLVIVKPLLPTAPYNAAVANSVAIIILYFNLAVLFGLTKAVFAIPTATKIRANINANVKDGASERHTGGVYQSAQ